MLTLSGASVYGLLQWRATRLPADQQKILRNEVLVARGSAKAASLDKEIQAETDRLLRERLQKNPDLKADIAEVRKQILEQIKAEYQIVPPGYVHEWEIDLGWPEKVDATASRSICASSSMPRTGARPARSKGGGGWVCRARRSCGTAKS